MGRPVNVSSPPHGAILSVWWLLRWVLVILLVFDQASSPLHHHRHDAGIDAQSLGATWHAAHAPQAQESDPTAGLSHSVLAVRPASAAWCEAAPGSLEQLTPFPSLNAIRSHSPDSGPRAVPGQPEAPSRSAMRSLPPASRAPPLHA